MACHATMYSGVHPDRHHLWFVWRRAPESSPFRWLRAARYLPGADLVPAHYFLSKTAGLFHPNTSWFGVPVVVHLPVRYWPSIDVSEKQQWDEDGYLGPLPTIFELLRRRGVGFEIVGMDKTLNARSDRIVDAPFGPRRRWTYVFIGDVDSLSHAYRQDSPEAARLLRELDGRLERIVARFAEESPEFDCIVFSDHGHIPVERKIDLYAHFARRGLRLNDYFHVIDANYARFWFRTDRERAEVERALESLDGGFVLDRATSERYRVAMPDNRYGDLIYYLDRPGIFARTIWGFSRGQHSMHGYLPDYPESDGVFLSTAPLAGDGPVSLVDILPTHLAALGLPVPGHVEGRSLLAAEAAGVEA
ncbi:MAG: alkaline phosphatase family protein, partial [Thermomicrobiaceae bacterium]|nr:alkaline phosphatase family protein [Thermomicrobiaceae bacterium]